MGSPMLFSKLWLSAIQPCLNARSLPGEVDVNIQVVDFNDCPPEFAEPPPSYIIPEDAITGSVLVDFTINDCDSGLNGVNGSRFSIIAGMVINFVHIGLKLKLHLHASQIIVNCPKVSRTKGTIVALVTYRRVGFNCKNLLIMNC